MNLDRSANGSNAIEVFPPGLVLPGPITGTTLCEIVAIGRANIPLGRGKA
jgi:hypothetical protein